MPQQLVEQDRDKQQQQQQQQLEQQQQQQQQQQAAQQKTPQDLGQGQQALQKLLAANARPEPKEVARILWQFPEEKAQIVNLLQQAPALGNKYVQDVIKETEGLHLDLKGQRLAWGDSTADGGNFFVAGAKEQGARAKFGDFTATAGKDGAKWQKGENWSGTIGKDGAHTEGKLGADQKLVIDANYKDKEARLNADYINGDTTLGAGLHGKDLEHLGGDLHGKTKVGDGTLSGKVSVDRDGKDIRTGAGVDYKDQQVAAGVSGSFTDANKWDASAQGKLNLDAKSSVNANAGIKREGQDTTVSAGTGYQGAGGQAGVSGSYTNDQKYDAQVQGKLNVGKDASVNAQAGLRQNGNDTTYTGGLGYQDQRDRLGLSGSYTDSANHKLGLEASHKFDDKTTGSLSLGHQVKDGRSTQSLNLGLKDEKNTINLGGSYTDRDNYAGKLDAEHKFDSATMLKARLEAGVQEGKTLAQLGLSGSHVSDDLVLRASLDAVKTDNGLDVKASGEAVVTLVGEKLYGQAFAKLDDVLNDPKYQVGGGITWTPKDKLAISLLGGMNQDGQFDARLQADFGARIRNAKDLDENKKKAVVSIFAGVRSGGMDSGMMNDRFGAGKFGTESGQAYFGVGFKF